MASDNLSQKISNLYEQIEDLRIKGVSDPEKAAGIISNALEELQVSLEELSAAEEELYQQNEELIEAAEEREKYINEIAEANEILKRQYEMLRQVQDGVIGADADFRIIYWNKGAELIYGFTEVEAIGKTFLELLRPTYDPGERERIFEELERHGRSRAAIRTKHKDGQEVIAEVHSTRLTGAFGKTSGFVVVYRDITERKKAENSLKESEEKFAKAFHSNSAAMTITRVSDGLIVDANESFERLFGYTHEETVGHSTNELGIWLTPQERDAEVERLLRLGKLPEHEVAFGTKSGAYINVLFSVELISIGGQRYILSTVMDITERKKAEEALQTALQRFYIVLSSMYASILLVTDEGRIEFANQAFCDFFGLSCTPAELIGLTSSEMVEKIKDAYLHPDEEVTRIKEVVDRGQPVKGEEIAMQGDRTCLRDFIPINIDGEPYGRLWYHIDITERKHAEEELKNSQRLLKVLIQNVNPGVALIDEHGKFTIVNPAFLQMFGLSEDLSDIRNVNDQNWGEWQVFEEDGTLLNADDHPVRKAAMTGKPVRNKLVGVRLPTGGDLTWMLISAEPILKPDGRIEMVICTYHDFTKRKQAEERLRETRDYLENLIDYANAPIIVWDTSFKITRFNHAFERLTGLRSAEVIGTPLNTLFPESTREESMEHIRRTLYGEHWETVEIPILKADGSVRTVLWNSANIYDNNGTTIVATIAQGQDITERKLMEEELRRSRDELDWKVRERTADLSDAKENLEVINEELQVEISEHEKTEKDLLKAKEAAEAAVQAKAAFLANMSHELRTPMNSVIGYSSLLLDDNLTPEQKEYIECIKNNGEALLALISDILEFSRAEKEKVELEHRPISLKHCIEESLDMVAIQAGQKGLNLAYTISYGTPDTIIGDHGRLRQILANLLSNAVKFTDKGDISVSVSSKAPKGNRSQIAFAVKDTGIGMPQDKMDRLFKPFTQLEYVISRKRDGAGLGLSICKRLVELMGGGIWAESEDGKGSTFYFTIQSEVAEANHLDLGETNKDIAYRNLSGQNPLSILVAEDNPSNQKVLVEMLKRMGYKPDAVADGKEVLQMLQIRPYDLIFMDIKMPEMSGLDAAKEIRRLLPEEKQPRIVAITAYAMEGDKEMCLEAGMDDYIAKPVLKKDLEAILIKYSGEPA